jgi:hypothetical protein
MLPSQTYSTAAFHRPRRVFLRLGKEGPPRPVIVLC